MCGITGWIDWNRDLSGERQTLEGMNQQLVCHGPDGEGIWQSRQAGLCHRQLLGTDPEGVSQPMVRRFGNRHLVITFHGRLFDTGDLYRELKSRGYPVHSPSGPELVLAAYAEWGDAAPEHLDGIFAFAIWDETEQSLFMARDRFGIKPLFYTERAGGFLFASKLKALLAHPGVAPEVDGEGLAEVLVMGPSRTPGHGVFKGIKELLPGYALRANRSGIHRHPYWRLESRTHADDLETTIQRVRELFMDAVRHQMESDVPVGAMLSGGLDSSAISACAAEILHQEGKGPLPTFSLDYVGNDRYFRPNEFQPHADAPWVSRMVDRIGSRHHEVLIDTPDLVTALEDAVKARDLPGMADVDSSMILFCREIKKQATVVLSGECADEVFGGYPWFHRRELVDADTFPWARLTDQRIRFLSPEVIQQIRPLEYVRDRYREALAGVSRLPGEDPEEARIREIFHLNLTRWMPTLVDRLDRMSMAAGLEVRVPFCDHRLVEYIWNVPWSMKRSEGREKGLLRKAMAGILPEDVLWRKKSPFPKTHHPVYLKQVVERALGILDEGTSPVLDLLDLDAWRRFADQDLKGIHFPWFGQLMNVPQWFAYLIQLDQWMKEYRVIIK